jgi:hypothetical protein
MHPLLAATLANNLSSDRVAASAARRAAKSAAATPGAGSPAPGEVVIRRAGVADAPALVRLGALDGDRHAGELLADAVSAHAVLVAEVDGTLEAALAVDGGLSIADPFRPSALHADLLALRARQLGRAAPRHRRARLGLLHPRTS